MIETFIASAMFCPALTTVSFALARIVTVNSVYPPERKGDDAEGAAPGLAVPRLQV